MQSFRLPRGFPNSKVAWTCYERPALPRRGVWNQLRLQLQQMFGDILPLALIYPCRISLFLSLFLRNLSLCCWHLCGCFFCYQFCQALFVEEWSRGRVWGEPFRGQSSPHFHSSKDYSIVSLLLFFVWSGCFPGCLPSFVCQPAGSCCVCGSWCCYPRG